MSKRAGTTLKIAGGFVALLLILQLVPVDRSNPPVTDDALALPDGDAGHVLGSACLDCHSYQTTWPWYAKVAPVSWWLTHHVGEGREHLNFSTWAALPPDRQDEKLEELIEMVREGEMPLRSYALGHPEARLGEGEREVLVAWARGLRRELGVEGGDDTGAEPGQEVDGR
jgi:hypothetical protein